jgi:hypothetical protein
MLVILSRLSFAGKFFRTGPMRVVSGKSLNQ